LTRQGTASEKIPKATGGFVQLLRTANTLTVLFLVIGGGGMRGKGGRGESSRQGILRTPREEPEDTIECEIDPADAKKLAWYMGCTLNEKGNAEVINQKRRIVEKKNEAYRAEGQKP